MTTITLLESDPRGPKAVELASHADQWVAYGAGLYGIRASDGTRVYLVTTHACNCPDAERRTCKHQLAVALHEALQQEAVR